MKFIFDCFTGVIVVGVVVGSGGGGGEGDGGDKLPVISCLLRTVENIKAVYSTSRRMHTLWCIYTIVHIHG
jgi:hypothetical protein